MNSYSGLAGFYDSFTRDVDYEAFADYYEKLFSELGGKSLLDLACGTGTLTWIMAGRGYDMTGTDASAEMLAKAMAKTDEKSGVLRPLFINQPMEELDLYGTVNGAYCSMDGINYVPPEALPEIFRRLHLFVEPGGLFVFDIIPREKLMDYDGQVFLDETEDVLCIWRAQYDEDENACIYGMDLFEAEGGLWRREREEHVEYLHSVDELCEMLGEAGFTDIRVCGELSLE
ncbi:MAG: methyltransferase domain-containing protein, partial [Oscillospiraceae bacterium]|nr:methyltransferase domain-containing protein [Oscillospiraceae bacterium]